MDDQLKMMTALADARLEHSLSVIDELRTYRDALVRIGVHQARLDMAIANMIDDLDAHGVYGVEMPMHERYIKDASASIKSCLPSDIQSLNV